MASRYDRIAQLNIRFCASSENEWLAQWNYKGRFLLKQNGPLGRSRRDRFGGGVRTKSERDRANQDLVAFLDGGASCDPRAIYHCATLAFQILDKPSTALLQDTAMPSRNFRMIHDKVSFGGPPDNHAGRLHRLTARRQSGEDGNFDIQAALANRTRLSNSTSISRQRTTAKKSILPLLHSCPGGVRKSAIRSP